MNDINDLNTSNGVLIKPKPLAEEERMAKLREQQKRERKEKLYSSVRKVIES